MAIINTAHGAGLAQEMKKWARQSKSNNPPCVCLSSGIQRRLNAAAGFCNLSANEFNAISSFLWLL